MGLRQSKMNPPKREFNQKSHHKTCIKKERKIEIKEADRLLYIETKKLIPQEYNSEHKRQRRNYSIQHHVKTSLKTLRLIPPFKDKNKSRNQAKLKHNKKNKEMVCNKKIKQNNNHTYKTDNEETSSIF